MQNRRTANGAEALLNSTQQIRVHWSGNIITLMGFPIVINVAIWSYFLSSYIDYLTRTGEPYSPYIVVASALSAIILGLWRLYTHYIDNAIAALYPEFLFCEGMLGIPPGHGTSAYLTRAVPGVGAILLDPNLTPNQRLGGISILVESKHIGSRGHFAIDIVTLILVLIMLGVSILWASEVQQLWLAITCPIITFIGLLLVIFGLCYYQKKPSERLIKQILSQIRA